MTQPDLFPPRQGPRDPDDHTLGCGQPPPGVTSGRVCAGTGKQPSCQLCPESPTYWRKTQTGGQATNA